MQLLHNWGYDELNVGGTALIMGDVAISYKGEAFYGDTLEVNLYAADISRHAFDLLYHIKTTREGAAKDIAQAKTGMVCFDYETRKVAVLTAELESRLKGIGK